MHLGQRIVRVGVCLFLNDISASTLDPRASANPDERNWLRHRRVSIRNNLTKPAPGRFAERLRDNPSAPAIIKLKNSQI
jgi:hypothetical protein